MLANAMTLLTLISMRALRSSIGLFILICIMLRMDELAPVFRVFRMILCVLLHVALWAATHVVMRWVDGRLRVPRARE